MSTRLADLGYTALRFALAAIALVSASGISEDRFILVKNVAQINDAVLITNISVAGKSVNCRLFVRPNFVQPASSFSAEGDWLQTMVISLINRTSKTIEAGSINIQFLDTGNCRTLPCATASINLGRLPEADAYNGRTGEPLKPAHPDSPALNWRPDQSIEVHLGEYLNEIVGSSGLSNFMPVTEVRRVAIYAGPFFFKDGMRWGGGGGYAVPDPSHPGKFRYLNDDYFPGRPGHNWPAGYSQ